MRETRAGRDRVAAEFADAVKAELFDSCAGPGTAVEVRQADGGVFRGRLASFRFDTPAGSMVRVADVAGPVPVDDVRVIGPRVKAAN